MVPPASALEKSAATDRLRRALLAFQAAQSLLLSAHRKAKATPEDANRFWTTEGRRIEAQQRAAAVAVEAAFKTFSAAGLVAGPADRHLVTEARRTLQEGA